MHQRPCCWEASGLRAYQTSPKEHAVSSKPCSHWVLQQCAPWVQVLNDFGVSKSCHSTSRSNELLQVTRLCQQLLYIIDVHVAQVMDKFKLQFEATFCNIIPVRNVAKSGIWVVLAPVYVCDIQMFLVISQLANYSLQQFITKCNY